jgi:hypothetical protein
VIGGYRDHLTVERGLAANTIASHRRGLRWYVEFLGAAGVEGLGEVGESDVAAFLDALRSGDDDHHRFALLDGLVPMTWPRGDLVQRCGASASTWSEGSSGARPGVGALTFGCGPRAVLGNRWGATVRWGPRRCGSRLKETSVQTVVLTPVAAAIAPRLPAIVGELLDLLLREIDELRGDEFVVGRLRASLESNVSTLLHLMEEPVDLNLVETPAGALQFAQRLAQRGVPFSALWRAYHLANARFFQICLHELAEHSSSVADLALHVDALSLLLHAYVDHLCDRIGRSYDAERERWLRHQDVVRTEHIQDLLAGRVGEVAQAETALGYRLTGRHVGLIAWNPAAVPDGAGLLGLQRLVTSCAQQVACHDQPLLVPRDQSTLWAWLPLPPGPAADCTDVLRRLVSGAASPVRFAVGEPGASVEGFARSHRQALVAQSVALAAGTSGVPVTPYGAVSGLGFLCQNLNRAREWDGETLGGLAVEDEPHARLRETVEAFLDTGGSLTAAAERLGCHKNTVQYRIRRAEEVLGRSVRERRVDLEVALQACRWLGPAVLVSVPLL